MRENDVPAFCKWCDEESHIKQGRIFLCKKHYRFQTMRTRAKRDGKSVPEYYELENLLEKTNMVCPSCSRPMNLLRKDGSSTVITLQHDRSGEHRLICYSCNMRHQYFSGDSFYSRDKTTKQCPRCKIFKPYKDYYKDNNKRWNSVRQYCKECSYEYKKEWLKRNATRKV